MFNFKECACGVRDELAAKKVMEIVCWQIATYLFDCFQEMKVAEGFVSSRRPSTLTNHRVQWRWRRGAQHCTFFLLLYASATIGTATTFNDERL